MIFLFKKKILEGKAVVNDGGFKIYGDIKGIPSCITGAIVAECLDGCFDINCLFKDEDQE